MATKPNREKALDAVKRTGSFSEGEKDALINAFRTSMFPGNWETTTPADGDTLVYNATTETWEFQPAGVGDLKADGTVPLTADWNVGAFDITAVDITATGAFTSRGIDDNATGTRITVADSSTTVGPTGGGFYSIIRPDELGAVGLSGGTALNSGANLRLYGGSHIGGQSGDIEMRGGSNVELYYDDSDSEWSFQANNIRTTGKYTSINDGNIDIEPHGTGNVLLGNFTFNADQTVGAGQDNYVLTYDNGTGLINLEASVSGFADPMTTRGDIIYKNAANATVRLPAGTANQVLTSDGTDIAWAASIAGVSVFTGLSDTPANYVGHANKFLAVNAGATAIEFTAATPVTQVTGSAPVVSSGGTTPAISMAAATASVNGYMTSTFATKLNGIEAGADVTDATNVAAAGAYMGNITIDTDPPSGGADGDIWFQVV